MVEMLVAVAVGLLVMVGLHQMFVSTVTTQTTTSSQMEVDRRVQVAMDEITSLLRQAAPSTLLLKPAVLDNYDAQHPDRIHFAGAPSPNLEPGPDVRYWVSTGQLRRNIGASGYAGGSVLATGVTDLRFTFYNAAGTQTTAAVETVRVAATLTIRDGRNWSIVQSSVKLRNT
jgi:phosphotransferase system  glucose/maltose/N-acetylglucosamine-specific IIC component